MLGTNNIVFKSADWLPQEMNGDRSETETCFSPYPTASEGKEKKLSLLYLI